MARTVFTIPVKSAEQAKNIVSSFLADRKGKEVPHKGETVWQFGNILVGRKYLRVDYDQSTVKVYAWVPKNSTGGEMDLNGVINWKPKKELRNIVEELIAHLQTAESKASAPTGKPIDVKPAQIVSTTMYEPPAPVQIPVAQEPCAESAEQLYLEAKPYKFMGKNQDLKKAFGLHIRAAQMGYAPAQYEVGYAYALGFGVEKNEKNAFLWYMKAAQQGHVTAQRNVGQRYSSGQGTEKDLVQARYWYQKAVEGEDTSAMFLLGQMYESGIGGKQHLGKALELYKQAKEKGSKEADNAYARLTSEMI